MKNKLAILLTLTIISTIMTGCEPNTLPSPEDPVTLTMWHVYGSQTKSPMNDAIDEFNSSVGNEYGITVEVVSITSSSAIDLALAASANGEPGAESMPDLFTAYPRVAEIVGHDNLLRWDDYFSESELSDFHGEFLTEGYFDGHLLMLPIAKSTEAFYYNKTLFDRFSADTGVSASNLDTFTGLFDAVRKYYDWSGGRDFMQINDYYHYAYVGMKAHGGELVRGGRLRLDAEAFKKVWEPLARTAIYGGICLDDGYAAARWKTADVIANIGSTADVLYQPEKVIFPDNTTEKIIAVALPYPSFEDESAGVIYRGGGLFARKSDDERKNRAAYIFAGWLTDKEHNLPFVTNAGYLPVTDGAFDELFSNLDSIEKENYRSVYSAADTMLKTHTFFALPLYEKSSEVQRDFEANVKAVLKGAHVQYHKRLTEGADPDTLMDELIESSLTELVSLSDT